MVGDRKVEIERETGYIVHTARCTEFNNDDKVIVGERILNLEV